VHEEKKPKAKSTSFRQTFHGVHRLALVDSVVCFASIDVPCLRSVLGVILMYVMRIDVNDQYKQHKLDYIDNCIMCLLFVLAIFNIFIAACS
jgi:hypothetical protein